MKVVGGLALVLVAAACTGGSNGDTNAATTTTSSSPTATPVGETTVRIEIPRTLVAGTTTSGTLVFTNRTGAPLELQTSGGCKPNYAVVIRNDAIPQTAAFAASCEIGATVVPEGTSRVHFTASTSYFGCTSSPNPQSVTPACLPGPTMPPLPPGRYDATLQAPDSDFPPATPVPVKVIAPK